LLITAARAQRISNTVDVTRILRVCGLTVTTRVKEFENAVGQFNLAAVQ
jgi:hypothetical protein